MSIYCSRTTVGYDFPFDQTGKVAAYPENNLRRLTEPGFPTDGYIETAHIPHWCVPGHDERDGCVNQCDDEPVAEWLRLIVSTAGAHVRLLVDREAVQALRDDLTAWLDLDHVADADERIE